MSKTPKQVRYDREQKVVYDTSDQDSYFPSPQILWEKNKYILRVTLLDNKSAVDLSSYNAFTGYYGNLSVDETGALISIANTSFNVTTDWDDISLANGRISLQCDMNAAVTTDIGTSATKTHYLQLVGDDSVDKTTLALIQFRSADIMYDPTGTLQGTSSSSSSIDSSSSSSSSYVQNWSSSSSSIDSSSSSSSEYSTSSSSESSHSSSSESSYSSSSSSSSSSDGYSSSSSSSSLDIYPEAYIMTGFGTAATNGLYLANGKWDNEHKYIKASNNYQMWWDVGVDEWHITNGTPAVGTSLYKWWTGGGLLYPDQESVWQTTGGSAPVGITTKFPYKDMSSSSSSSSSSSG